MSSRGGSFLALGWLAWLVAACSGSGEQPTDPEATELPPIGAPLSTRCERTGVDWLDLEARLPGRWHYGGPDYGQYTEVVTGLEGSWGTYAETGDVVEGTSTWTTNADGLIVETGDGPCAGGVACDARFVQSGTLAAGATKMSFYALWPVDPCQTELAGTYEGREFYENNDQTGGELRMWSERSERITLRADGTWHWQYETTTYASVNDRGDVYWDREPVLTAGEDSGTYEAVTDGVSFLRDGSSSSYWIPSTDGTPRTNALLGRALQKNLVSVYERVTP